MACLPSVIESVAKCVVEMIQGKENTAKWFFFFPLEWNSWRDLQRQFSASCLGANPTQDMKLRKEAVPLLVNGQAAEREQEQPISGYQCISIKTTDEHRLKNMIA